MKADLFLKKKKTDAGFEDDFTELVYKAEKYHADCNGFYMGYDFTDIIACIDILQSRIKCLTAAKRYLMKQLSNMPITIYGYSTPVIIDSVCDEYGVNVNAAADFKIRQLDNAVNAIYPYHRELSGGLIVEENRPTANDYYIAERKAIKRDKVSSESEILLALDKIRTDIDKLDDVRTRVLSIQPYMDSLDDIMVASYRVNGTGLIYKRIKLLDTGTAYLIRCDKHDIDFILTGKAKIIKDELIDYNQSAKAISCSWIFYPEDIVEAALNILSYMDKRAVMTYTKCEWESACHRPDVQSFISKICK